YVDLSGAGPPASGGREARLEGYHHESPASATTGCPLGTVRASTRPGKRSISSATFSPVSASNRAGAWATILVRSAVIWLAPIAAWSPPVETIVILSTFASGSLRARTTSGRPV